MSKIHIFLLCLLTRICFKLFSGYNNFELFLDSYRYDNLSNKIIQGEADMDIIAYLAAPLYPYLLALIKLFFGSYWQTATIAFQFLLIALSAVYIKKISKLIFNNERIATLSALLYIFYPLTLWYNFTIVQENCFQALFIFGTYYFIKSLDQEKPKTIFLSASLFSLAFLTKSHILMILPFLLLILYLKTNIKALLVFLFGFFIWTLPHGIINYKKHQVFTLSSHGNASFFLLGHSDQTFPCLIKRAGEMGEFSAEGCNPDFVFNVDYEYPNLGYVNKLDVKSRNSVRLQLALDWIRENPTKYVQLKWLGIQRFILPGLDWKQYKFSYWLLSFLLGLLIYIPAYLQLIKSIGTNPLVHLVTISAIITCAAVFIVFFPVNRFRVITMEPLLCVYAGAFYHTAIIKLRNLFLND